MPVSADRGYRFTLANLRGFKPFAPFELDVVPGVTARHSIPLVIDR